MAGDNVSGLTPCGENPAFQKRAANATTDSAKARFEFYGNSSLLCGADGLPHLVVDGDLAPRRGIFDPQYSLSIHCRLDRLGLVGGLPDCRGRDDKKAEEKEIIIDVPLAVKCMLTGFAGLLTAFKDIASGAMFAKDDESHAFLLARSFCSVNQPGEVYGQLSEVPLYCAGSGNRLDGHYRRYP